MSQAGRDAGERARGAPALPYFHPTTVVLVDDEPRILQTASRLLENCPAVARVESFARAQDALAWLAQRPAPGPEDGGFEGARVRDVLAADARTLVRSIDLPLAGLPARLARSRTAGHVSVVVSDFAMPGMDGLEFFARLPADGTRRVLLTALCDERDAVAAFNEGWIHRFLHKGDPRGPLALPQDVASEARAWFAARLAHVAAALRAGPGGQFPAHPAVAEWLEGAAREGACREYCFRADPPGFHLDGEGPGSRFLALADAGEFERCARVVGEVEGDADLAAALRARAVMPVARDGQAIYEHGAQWRAAALVPAPLGRASGIWCVLLEGALEGLHGGAGDAGAQEDEPAG